MSRPTRITLSTSALQHNLNRARALAPTSKIMVPVKCNAYGHGIDTVVKALDCDAFAVACLEEAVLARQYTDKPIVLLEGCFDHDELERAQQLQCEVVVHCEAQMAMLEAHPELTHLPVWLKINTGMCRLGIKPEEFKSYWQRLMACEQVAKPIKVMTHFANADSPHHPMTAAQIECFKSTVKDLGIQSLANSGATLSCPESHADWIRPGLMIYGVSPFADQEGPQLDLQPAMTMSSALIALHELKRGDAIGYGSRYLCADDMRIGIIAMGYGDGYPRRLPNGTPVRLKDGLAPIVGTISMDMAAIDVSKHPTAKLGDEVILWGQGLPIERIARLAETIPYELLCNVHQRIERRVV